MELTADLVTQLSAADRAIARLAGAAEGARNVELLVRPLVRREAVLSSRIEGTRASLTQLVLFEAGGPAEDRDDVGEVLNAVSALQHVLDPGRRLPLSLPLLLEAHEILMTGVRGGQAAPGEFRRTPNWIGPPGSLLDTATYVPPPPERLWDCLDPFERYLHEPRTLPPLLDIAALHYQFEAIHPFLDGNGRVGRLLVVLLLVEWGLLPAAVLDLSAYIEAHRPAYYDALLRVSTEGDWHRWLRFMLRALEVQAGDALVRSRLLAALREDYRQRVVTPRSSPLLVNLVDELFAAPVITINRAREILGVTHRAATLNLERLVELGIVHEVGTRRPRLFIADELLRIVEGGVR